MKIQDASMELNPLGLWLMAFLFFKQIPVLL